LKIQDGPGGIRISEQSDHKGKGFFAVIPARGGSKGLPGKNRRTLQGISLVGRAVLIARMIHDIRWAVVSTDDADIADEAKKYGGSVPFLRPADLSRSRTPMKEVLSHAWAWLSSSHPEYTKQCDGMVLLQPTSPMRRVEDVTGAMSLFKRARAADPDVAGVHTVSPVPREVFPDALWRLRGKGDGFSDHVFERQGGPESEAKAREIAGFFYRNGAAVVLDPERLGALTLSQGTVLPYVIERPIRTIDSLFDLLLIEHCVGRLEPDKQGVSSLFRDDPGACSIP
jgi:hypothetical protein